MSVAETMDRTALQASAMDRAALQVSAREMIDLGRVVVARPLVAALARMAPEVVEICELEARLLAREGRAAEAIACLDAGRARFSDAMLPMLSAEIRLRGGEPAQAADDAAAAVIAEPGNAQAKALLGCALGRLGAFADAQTCLHEAIRTGPLHPAFRQALAEVQERAGDSDAASATLAEALADWPANPQLITAAIMVAMRRRDFARAASLCESARSAGVADATIYGLWGHAHSSLGDHAAAGIAYEEARKLAPGDPYVRHLAATAGVIAAEARAPSDYVETVFDGYADRFEAHLIALGYRVPGLIRALLIECRGESALGDVLDLGCGTGFVGVVLSDLKFTRLVGVDLSAQMLKQAASKEIYTELRQGDLQTALANSAEPWDLIVAADTLTYFGDLDGLLADAHDRLRPGALFLFSVERATGPSASSGQPWQLERCGRYVHRTESLIESCKRAGFTLRAHREEVLRFEAGAPVDGLIVALERPHR